MWGRMVTILALFYRNACSMARLWSIEGLSMAPRRHPIAYRYGSYKRQRLDRASPCEPFISLDCRHPLAIS